MSLQLPANPTLGLEYTDPTTGIAYKCTDSIASGDLFDSWGRKGAILPEEAPIDGTPYSRQDAGWVNASSGSASGVPLGGIINYSSETPPAGFLPADGSQVSTTTYAELYAAVGDSNSPLEDTCHNGMPWKSQYDFNNEVNGDLIWTLSSGIALNNKMDQSQAVVTKNHVYLFGGYDGSASSNVIQHATIDSGGILSTFTRYGTDMPATNKQAVVLLVKDKIYLIGGYGTAPRSAVYYIDVNADGTLDGNSWISSTSLAVASRAGSAFIHNSIIYYIGGNDPDGITGVVHKIKVDGNGLTDWVKWRTGEVGLSFVITNSQIIKTFNNTYSTYGGYTTKTVNVTVDYILKGPYVESTPRNRNTVRDVSQHQCVSTKNSVHIIGGYTTGEAATKKVSRLGLNINGMVDDDTLMSDLPATLNRSQVIITSSRIYLLGGRTGTATSAITTNIYEAAFSGGKNDYMSDIYIKAVPETGMFYLPKSEIEASLSNRKPEYPMVRVE